MQTTIKSSGRPRGTAIFCVFLIWAMSTSLPGAESDAPDGLDWRGDPPRPLMSLPRCEVQPRIDGRFDKEEWQDGVAVSSLMVLGKANGLGFPPTTLYLARDAQHLYFAFRCLKEKPVWYDARHRFRDSEVYREGNYVEFYLSPPGERGHIPVYQFNMNSYGAIADWRKIPAIGLKERGFNARIELESSQSKREWYCEGRMKMDALSDDGFRDDQRWRANFARSWPQQAWSLRPGRFINRENLGFMHLRPEAPALRWEDMSELHARRLHLPVTIKNTSDAKQRYHLSARVTGKNYDDAVATVEETVELTPGEQKRVVLSHGNAPLPERGHVELTCQDAEKGTVYYHQFVRYTSFYSETFQGWEDALKKDVTERKELRLRCAYGQLSETLSLRADLWPLTRAGQKPGKVTFSVHPKDQPGKTLITRDVTHFQKDMALSRIAMPEDAPHGTFVVEAMVLDEAGETAAKRRDEFQAMDLTSREVNRKRRSRPGRIFDWIGNDIGRVPGVLPPWHPIRIEDSSGEHTTLSVWGREVKLGSAGLPEQITSGQKTLLASGIQLVCERNGKTLILKNRGTNQGGGLPVESDVAVSEVRWEGSGQVDELTARLSGHMLYDGMMSYTLHLECEEPVELDALYLDIPIDESVSRWIHVREGLDALPLEEGTVWQSNSICDNPLTGTLTSHVWIGNSFRGLAWIGDSTRGWYEKPHESSLTVHRGEGGVHLRAHFVRGPATVDSTEISFSLLPTPTKPRPAGWRAYPHFGDWRFRWWFGGWPGMLEPPGEKGKRQKASWDDPPPAHRTEGVQEVRKINRGNTYRLPYTNPTFSVPLAMPWRVQNASPVAQLLRNEWSGPVESYRDWAISNMAYWMELHGYPGWYVDEAYQGTDPEANLLNGSGWFDRHGDLRSSYHSIDVRKLFHRMYGIGHTKGRLGRGFILNHISFGMAPHVMSFAAAGCIGESVMLHTPGESLLDVLSLERLQFLNGRAWGFFGTYFGHNRLIDGWGRKDEAEKEKCRASIRKTYGALMLHDMVPNGPRMPGGWGPIRQIKKDFGIGEPDVRFTGYWYPDAPVACSSDNVKCSVFTRPNRSLLVIVNTDTDAPHESRVKLAPGHPDFHGTVGELRDAVTGDTIALRNDGFAIKLGAGEVRYVFVQPTNF